MGFAMEKILLDTDIGCDYDDMYTLAYLLLRNDVEILGITTVTGEPELRAQLASVMCTVADKDIPIRIGSGKTVKGDEFRQNAIVQGSRDVLAQFPHRNDFPEDAVEFLKDMLEKYPGEITLCAIGPLTNIAELFTKYPHTANLIKKLVIMGGRFGEVDTKVWGENEWNIINDIDAAKIVFDAPVENVYVFGVELTSKCFVEAEEMPLTFGSVKLYEPCFVAKKSGKLWFHDPITVAAVFCTDGMTFEKGRISVTDKGETVFTKDANGNHTLMTDMDNDLFFNHYCETVGVKRAF